MPARVIDAADKVVSAIEEFWGPTPPAGVERVYLIDIDSGTLEGRRVYVLPGSFTWDEHITRIETFHDNTVSVLIVERLTCLPAEQTAWLDERVEFVEALLDLFNDDQNPPTPGLWLQNGGVDPVYDLEELSQRNLFFSVLSLTLRGVA